MKNGLGWCLVLAAAVARPALGDTAAGERRADPQPAAIVAGETIGSAEVDELIGPQLMELRSREQQLREQALELLISKALIRKEASARGQSEQALESQEIDAKAAITASEAKAFYDANKARFGSTPEDAAIRQIQEGLGRQRRSERRSAFARELRAKYPVRVLLEPFRVPVEVGGAPARGNPNAPVTVVEFSDFQCPFCVRARPVVTRVREAYGDKVRWVFRHFPLEFHELAQKAGEAAACAGEQGKFWEMHDRLWASDGKLQVAELKVQAAAIGLEAAAFDGCLDSGREAGVLKRDEEAGASYGVSGTPAFFVNGRPLVGAQPFESFQQVIDDELRRLAPAPVASK